MTPVPSRRTHLRNLFLQNTGTLRIQAPKPEPRVNELAGFMPSYGYRVNGRMPVVNISRNEMPNLNEWMMKKMRQEDERIRRL